MRAAQATCLIVCMGMGLPRLLAAAEFPLPSSIAVKGLQAVVDIRIDRWGVSHIYAENSHDAFFGQGWNAARDRLWQIDLWRRSGLGELAAVLGSSYALQDRAARLFVYRGDMQREWAAYGPQAKANTEAFVAGINAYVASVRRDSTLMPQEFTLAGYQPAFWNADDVVRVRNHGLGGGAELEAVRAQMACKAGLSVASMLIKIAPSWTPVIPQGLNLCSIPANVLAQYELAQKPVSFRDEGKEGKAGALAKTVWPTDRADNPLGAFLSQGSNNWVIAPSKTTTGRPILANDPHREYEVPSLRYLVHIMAPGLNIIGSGEPALPGISIGHNDHIAFGLTIFGIAQEDLYVYETNPQDSNQYRYNGAWESMRIVEESIAVHGGSDQVAKLKFTRHGPVVMEDPKHNRAYAVRATWLDTGGAPYFGSMRYLRAQNVSQFAAAAAFWGGPPENLICADTRGTVGWFPAGFTPIRTNTDGLLPLPGDGRYEWSGYLGRNLLPSEIDPARKYIATANQMDLPHGYPYAERRIGFTWADDFRFNRISEVLDGLQKVSIKDSEELQNDYVTEGGRRLIRVLGSISTPDAKLQGIVRWLMAWDARVTAQSPQAALFEDWFSHHLAPAVVNQVAPSVPAAIRELLAPGELALVMDLMEHPDSRLGSEPLKIRDHLMLATLATAYEDTRQRLGADRSAWQWGRLARALFEHQLSSRADQSLRANMNVGPAPKDGDGSVVGAAAYSANDFRVRGGAAFRMVLDVGRWDNSVAVNSPGQSGNPSSAHYRDLFPLWITGKYFPLLYSRKAIEAATERRIRLRPK